MFPDLLHFAYELHILATGRETWDVKEDPNSIQKWVGMNKMDLAMDGQIWPWIWPWIKVYLQG